MRKPKIAIFGDGIAGLSAAKILVSLGYRVAVTPTRPPAPRQVALNGAARFLLERIWGRDPLLRAAHHTLALRTLVWDGVEPIHMDDEVAVADIADLAACMKWNISQSALVEWDENGGEPQFVAGPYGNGPDYLMGGVRLAVQAEAVLNASCSENALYVEAVPSGWLAILPTGKRRATLMGVTLDGISLSDLLSQSRHARKAIAQLSSASKPTSAAARLHLPAGDGATRILIGDVAMRFDPISGDGVTGALRGGHLAALLFHSAFDGKIRTDIKVVYQQRLAQAMRAHLGGLAKLYSVAPFAVAWADELCALVTMKSAIDQRWTFQRLRLAINEDSLAFPYSLNRELH